MKRLLSLSLSLALVFTLAACTISDGEQTAAPDGSGGSAPSSDAQAPASSSEPESIAFDQEFSSGNYTAGVDFPAGKYDIVAVSGGGNVSSSNAFSGGINAVMGTEEQNEVADMYEQEYKNIDLPEGVVLSISGVTVRLTCDDASGRCLSADRQALASLRVMASCMGTGQAAGVAAAQSVASRRPVQEIDTARLVSTLKDLGAVL